MTVDLKQHCSLALEALEAMLPVSMKAGILSDPIEAYDEWETLVQAVFKAFVVLPICDTSGDCAPDQFHRLGFEPEKGKLVISFDAGVGREFIFDIIKNEQGKMCLEVRSLGNPKSASSRNITVEEGSRYTVLVI